MDGHNVVGGIAGDRLRSFIERIERLESEKASIAEDIKEVYAEAKSSGFIPRVMRQIIKERRMDKDALDEQEALLDVYRRALGMLIDTPLGEAALERAAARSPAKADKATDKGAIEQRLGQARTAGAEDGRLGRSMDFGPYPEGTPEREAYQSAWQMAQAARVHGELGGEAAGHA